MSKEIFRGVWGSRLYGLETEGSDHDTVSIVRPSLKEALIDNFKIIQTASITKYETKTDHTEIPLAKFFHLLTKSSPNVCELLCSKHKENIITPEWLRLMDYSSAFLNSNLIRSLNGVATNAYKDALKECVSGNRQVYIQKYGYDTKAAMQSMRALMQILQLQEDKTITFPFNEEERKYLIDIKLGKMSRGGYVEVFNDLLEHVEPLQIEHFFESRMAHYAEVCYLEMLLEY